jgi:peroxiredoxin
VRFPIFALALLPCIALGCGEPAGAPSRGEAHAASNAATPAVKADAPKKTPARPRGRPLPAFGGWTLDDQRLEVADLIGKRLLIYFFNPDVKDAAVITDAVKAIAPQRGKHNFEIVGIATGAARENAIAFAQDKRLDFPVIDDSSARLARRFGLREPIAMLGVDTEGFLSFALTGFDDANRQALEANLRQSLRLPEPALERPRRPQAPPFAGAVLDSDERFDLAVHQGEPVVLIFFLHTCPHCHAALRFLRETLTGLPEDKRPLIVGVEVTGRTYAVRQKLRDEDLDFFPVLFDDDGSIQSAYGMFGIVPDIFFIDREGRITDRVKGWFAERDEPLVRMRTARIGGAEIPMLLRTNGYSGNEVCGVCHQVEHETWTFTTHASAYDTLVRHGAENDAECVRCHVVGQGQPGGFLSAPETPGLEDVGCETCHGRGGPHLSAEFAKIPDYTQICVTCHDAKHSLGFDYATFLPRISHAANAPLLALPPEEKQRLLAQRGRPGGALLPTNASYVGSEACRSCHEAEFATWAASPHARAGATLREQSKADETDCQRCHTTAFDQPGGFPGGGNMDAHSDLARVGCESCHGPGAEHVKEGAPRIGNVLSLADKCDSCVILQICGSCHDEANDPGFEFSVQEKIERQRHGTIEPGTGKPKGETVQLDADRAGRVAHAPPETPDPR